MTVRMLTTLILALQLHAAAPTWKVFARTGVTWRPGAPPYELLMEESVAPRDVDPVHRVRIRVPGRPDFTVIDARGAGEYVPVREALRFASPELIPPALSDSARVIALPVRGPRASTILAVFGWAYASDPYELTLIGFDSTGYPRQLFRHDFDLRAVADLDADGVPELIGLSGLSQASGTCSATYNPYAVYRVADSGDLRYDLALSRQYNQAHYVWAGSQSSERIEVEHCATGKYRFAQPKH